MSEAQPNPTGSISWMDLTVPDAAQVREFYSQVVGWKSEALSMGDYDDYCMATPEEGKTVAGVCHARGANANIPPQWMIYITVADLDASVARCRDLGGEIVVGPKDQGGQGRYCIIKDPAGAVCGLYQTV